MKKKYKGLGAGELREAYADYTRDEIASRPMLSFSTYQDAARLAGCRIGHEDYESLFVLYLSSQNKLISDEIATVGTVDRCICYPREICKRALMLNATGVILAHNHPSGNPRPSKQDDALTRRLNDSLRILGMTLVDHVIVTRYDESYSYAATQSAVLR